MNRREFLVSASMAAGAMASSARARCESRKYKACLIADSKQGGVGHSMHLAFGLRDDVAVVALAEPDEGARAKYGADAGVERTYADYREMLDKEHPDLVAIGPRWSIHHKEYILACAEVGAHGLIEKPLSVDLEEADAMMTAIGAKNLRWAIGFNVRSMPPIAHLKKLLWEESLIGTILDARGRGKEDARAGGEDLIVLGSHVLDLMAYLMDGAPGWCFSDITVGGRPAKPEDVHDPTEGLGPVVGDRICATYGFAAGVKGFFASMANPDGSGAGSASTFTAAVASSRFVSATRPQSSGFRTQRGRRAAETWPGNLSRTHRSLCSAIRRTNATGGLSMISSRPLKRAVSLPSAWPTADARRK